MKYWAKVGLGGLAIAGLLGVYFGEQQYSEKEAASKKQASKALHFESGKLRRLSLKNAHGEFAFERASATAAWKMVKPELGVRPDQDTVNTLVAALDSLTLEQEIPGTEKALEGEGAAQYGLQLPRVSIELEMEDSSKKMLRVGSDVGVGNTMGSTFSALSVFASSPSFKNLLMVNSSVIAATDKTFSDFRTKLAGDFAAADVKSLTLERFGEPSITLVKGEKGWAITQPRELPADGNNIGQFIDKLVRWKVEKVTEKAVLNPASLLTFGLAQPKATVKVNGEDGTNLQTFQIGLTKEAGFVTMADGAVGQFPMGSWTDFVPDLKHFRDRRVMREVAMDKVTRILTNSGRVYQKEGANWYFVSKNTSSADQKADSKDKKADSAQRASDRDAAAFFQDWEFLVAENIIEGSETKDLKKFGLHKPIQRFSFQFGDNEPMEEILVGNRVPLNEKAVYIKRATKPDAIYVVETQWLEPLARMDGSEAATSPQAQK